MTSSPIKVIIADDHPLVLEGLAGLLQTYDDIEVVAEAKNGREVISLTTTLNPDVILTDIEMPEMDGFELIKQLAAGPYRHVPVIACSYIDSVRSIEEIMLTGAKGYILKAAARGDIVKAIRTVMEGNTFYCSHTVPKMDAYLKQKKQHNGYAQPKELTDKETEIVCCTCEEMTNKEIAIKMNLSPRTIEDYKEKIYRKTNTANAIGIVKYAIGRHLVRIK
jgi:DNA-binding NarL/FixJ family response regulator